MTLRCTLALGALLLACSLQPTARADTRALPVQDADPLAAWLAEGDAAKRKALRDDLLKLGADALREKIRAWKPAPLDVEGSDRTLKFTLRGPDGFSRPCFVHVPNAYRGDKPWPVLFTLHGGVHAHGEEAARATLDIWRPYCVNAGDQWLIVAFTPDVHDTTNTAAYWRPQGMELIHSTLRSIKQRFHVDDERVFLAGQSDGGSGTWYLAYRRPNAFAAFMPTCGHPLVGALEGLPALFENCKNARVYNLSGDKDPLYPGRQIAKIVGEIRAVAPNVTHKSYPDAGHDLSFADKEFPGLLQNMATTWKRDLLPRQIDWSAERADLGRNAWLSIDGFDQFNKLNKAPEPKPRNTGVTRIDFGAVFAFSPDSPVVTSKVHRVEPGTLADSMGLKAGDVITKLDNKPVHDLDSINAVLRTKGAGKELTVTVTRDGESKTFSGKFSDLPKPPIFARVQGTRSSGTVDLKIHNAAELSVYVAPEMLSAKGELKIKINGKQVWAGKVEPDADFILDEFERTLDRGLPFMRRIEIDAYKALAG